MKQLRKAAALLLVFALTIGSAFAAGGFTDVEDDAYYAEAVHWAADEGITQGRGEGVFAPDDTVTLAEAVTFLWRFAGQPESVSAPTEGESWYAGAAQWAAEQGIINGTDNLSEVCSRAAVLIMLYRMEGSPYDAAMEYAVPEDSEDMTWEDIGYALIQAFVESMRSEELVTDWKEEEELPVCWAILSGILGENQVDMESQTVSVDTPCSRGEMVACLYATAQYEEQMAAAEENQTPAEPIEIGTIPETVVLDKDGVKITVTGIGDHDGDIWLDLSVENHSDTKLSVDAQSLFVNSYVISTSSFIAIPEDYGMSFDDVVVSPGETLPFHVGLNWLRESGISAVYEIELQMALYQVTEGEDGDEYEEYALGDPVTIQTSLYSDAVSYDQEGTAFYDKDGLTILVTRAENSEYMGPQISIYAYNSGSEDVSLELSELKLDGEACEAFFGMYVPAGKRNVETVSIDLETIPVVKEAELTLQTLDPESWEAVQTIGPVTVPFAE